MSKDSDKQNEQTTELWEQYQHEISNGYGFGAASEWSKGPRSFAEFCTAKRLTADTDKALALLGVK